MLIRNDVKSYLIQKLQNIMYPEAPICVSLVGVFRKCLNLCSTPLNDVNENHNQQQRYLTHMKLYYQAPSSRPVEMCKILGYRNSL